MKNRTVRLTTCVNSYEAHVLKGALQAEGIACALHNENMCNLYGGAVPAFDVDVFVFEDELERAKEIMEAARNPEQTSTEEQS